VDALGPRADEGRGKAAKSLDEPSNRHSRGCPNGETCSGESRFIPMKIGRVSGGTETSKYPEEKKSTEIP
jgi:hypothetical protein